MEMIQRITFLFPFLCKTIPLAKRELAAWREGLSGCKSRQLQRLARKSIQEKAFHCIGGSSFYNLKGAQSLSLLQFIVSFQTISDYLDTLCDEGGIYCEKSFRQLHKALEKALMVGESHDDYYSFYPQQEDGGYLESLVEKCQRLLVDFPSYRAVQGKALKLVHLYIDLQSLKHLSPENRENRLIEWHKKKCSIEELSWYEFAAACGSTLGIFSLLSLACKEKAPKEEVVEMYEAYYPWVCGLHILLDYLIDALDDKKTGELNFISFYPKLQTMQERLLYFFKVSLSKTARLPNKSQHKMIVLGLLALYLSDQKARAIHPPLISHLIKKGGVESLLMHRLALLLRRWGYL